ncbi:MAG: single-stranded-DNA-specific exonuclease RecJ [Anaerolineae bacterium]
MLAQRWTHRPVAPAAFLGSLPDLDPVLVRVLYARGYRDIEAIQAFLDPPSALQNPFEMRGVTEAIQRILGAVTRGERIVVYGDFDADGVTATTLLTSALRMLTSNVQHYIPDRFDEGYGLNADSLERLAQEGANLVITVDCGIRSRAEIAHARSVGLEMIITDHHSVPSQLPADVTIINPKQPGCDYAFKDLAGVGVAYRLTDALFAAARKTGLAPQNLDPRPFLDLVAIGTVADMVPMVGENRVLARAGLERIRSAPRVGVRELVRVSGTPLSQVDSQAIAFRLAPRINAAGRLDTAHAAYRLLASEDPAEAAQLAQQLDAINDERKQLLDTQTQAAARIAREQASAPLLFIQGPDYHEGIVGLIASRLCETYYRPTLVMRADGESARGSARSIPEFHITHALEACDDLLVRYGGHAQAAGFTLRANQLSTFRERLLQHAAERLAPHELAPQHRADALVSLGEISESTVDALSQLEPVGEENPEAVLATIGLEVRSVRPVGRQSKHLQLRVGDGTVERSVIAFRMGHLAREISPGDAIDLMYVPSINTWQGRSSLQLRATAIRPSRT